MTMRKTFLYGALSLLGACASVMDGRKQEVSFIGNVEGIKIKKDGMILCETPCLFLLDRALDVNNENFSLTAEKEGYQTGFIKLKSKVNPWFFGNFITGGLLGSTTDLTSTNAGYEYAPSQYYVSLFKEGEKETKLDEVRRFVLKTYPSLQKEAWKGAKNKEHLQSLSTMTGLSEQVLIDLISKAKDAPACANAIAEKVIPLSGS